MGSTVPTSVHRTGRRTLVVLLAISALGIAAAWWPAPGASALTLGQTAPPGGGSCNPCEQFQLKTAPTSPSYRVPKGRWTITSWSVQGGGADTGLARLRVYRRTKTAGKFRLIGQSRFESIPANTTPSFGTSVRVRRGDRLGLRVVENLPVGFPTGVAEDVINNLACIPMLGQTVGTGTSCTLNQVDQARVNVLAKLRKR